jgi:AAA domain
LSSAGRSGGPGTAGGVDFQARFVAWVVCSILAETEAPSSWGWPEHTSFDEVHAETDNPTDDVLVVSSVGSRAFVQAKLRVHKSESPTSPLGKAIAQFVRQYRSTDPRFRSMDRLVLAVGPSSSAAIRVALPRILGRIRTLPSGAPLSSAAKNQDEGTILAVVIQHIEREWTTSAGSRPTEGEVRAVLAALWVSVYDLIDGGASAREAEQLLRASVLREPATAGIVLKTLIAKGLGYSAHQVGVDRTTLHRELEQLGISLRAAPSYRADVERLMAQSQSTLSQLARFRSIVGPQGEIRIERAAASDLFAVADRHSVVVTGDPGAGKSAALDELARHAVAEGRDVVVLAAGSQAAGSLGMLRTELGLDHEVLDVLRNWPGVQPGLLVIDALDAARGEHTQDALLDLIGFVAEHAPRWRIVVSMRRFDLRYNETLRAIFHVVQPMVAEKYRSAEFTGVAHFNVPSFSDDELAQLADRAPELHAVIAAATTDLRALVRVPFNLRLLAELIDGGVAGSELAPITTQLQLLTKYWRHRVIKRSGGDAREAFLRRVCETMIEARMLTIDRSAVQTIESNDQPLEQLLSDRVLVEEETDLGVHREVIAFGHHVLFDYAVAQLLLAASPHAALDRAVASPELLLLVRPSYDLHLRGLWGKDGTRDRFWSVAHEMSAEPALPAIGLVLAPVVAAELIEEIGDVRPLLDVLLGPASDARTAADRLLEHTVGARLSTGTNWGTHIPPERRTTWARVADELSKDLRTETAPAVGNLLLELCAEHRDLTDATRAIAGEAARTLLMWLLNREPYERALVRVAIQAVARTFAGDAAASAELLRRLIGADRLEAYGFMEMPVLCREVEHLLPYDPALVQDVYAAVFAYFEESKEPTVMRGGGVMPLTSHRSQDYAMAKYALAEAYPAFLNAAPSEALDALAAVRLAYGAQHGYKSPTLPDSIGVRWGDESVTIRHDGSEGRDSDVFEHHDEAKLLNAFEQWLAALSGPELRNALRLLRSSTRPSSMWRSVLRAAAANPTRYAKAVASLVTAPDVLASPELSPAASVFLQSGFAALSKANRRAAERAILALPDVLATRSNDPSHGRDVGERSRDGLLALLDPASIMGVRAGRLAAIAREALHDHDVDARSMWSSSGDAGHDYLTQQGVDIDAPANARIRELIVPVKAFAAEHLNGIPSSDQVQAADAPLRKLWDAVQSAPRDGVHDLQAADAWIELSKAAEVVARNREIAPDTTTLLLVRDILLAAAERDDVPIPEDTSAFDACPSWSNSCQINASEGLCSLARHAELASPELLSTIDALSHHPHPAVRYQIATRLNALFRTAPILRSEIARRIVEDDPSSAVVAGLAQRSLHALSEPPGDWSSTVVPVRTAFERFPADGAGVPQLRETCASEIASIYLDLGSEEARAFLDDVVIGDLKSAPHPAEAIVRHVLRSRLTIGDVEPSDAEGQIRTRAIGLAEELLDAANAALQLWTEELQGQQLGGDDPSLTTARTVAGVIDSIGNQLYFATGIFDEKQDKPVRISMAQRERLYHEAAGLIDRLCEVSIPSTTHHVLEALEAFLPFDPRGVFLRIATSIKAGTAGGYQSDSLAIALVVRLIERYLAEHRTLLQQDDECRAALIYVLDIFVLAGWPEALRLTYRLQDIYR